MRIILALLVAAVLGCGKADEPKEMTQASTAGLDEGYAQLAKGDISSAIKSFDTVIQQDPTNSANYIPLGEVYLRLKNFTAAVDTFNAATRVNPLDGEAQYFLALSSMLKAQVEASLGNEDEVEYYKNKAVAAGKQSAEIFLQAKDEEKFKKAVALVQSLVNPTPSQ